ncbi:arylsulfotransferase family protein [Gordonia sp. NPDC003429]
MRPATALRTALLVAVTVFGSLTTIVSTTVAAPADAAPRLPTFPIGAAQYTVNVNKPGGPGGYVFYTTGLPAAVPLPIAPQALAGIDQSAIIADKSGRVVWRYTPPNNEGIENFRTQTYQGRKVLTWWQGPGAAGHGAGADYIADTHGHVIKTLTPGDGLTSDVHEFRLTPDGRALITSYREVAADLTSVGGPRKGTMLDCIASVVDVATGRPLWHWSALAHIPVSESSATYTGLRGAGTYDPFHMNSIALDPSGNLLISFRNLNAIYNVDVGTGVVNWQLGGKKSSFVMGPGSDFFGQHDAEYADPTTIRMFDNNIDVVNQLGDSSIKWVRIDPKRHTATLVRAQGHPGGLATAATGNAQALPGGYTFGSWGTAPHISEFSASGEMTYDATLPIGTYRAYLDSWP